MASFVVYFLFVAQTKQNFAWRYLGTSLKKSLNFVGVDEKITKSSGGKTNRAEQNKQTNKKTKRAITPTMYREG